MILLISVFNIKCQTLDIKNKNWKSETFWGSGNNLSSKIYLDSNSNDKTDFESSIIFDRINFISTKKNAKENEIKQIKGIYHLYKNGYIKIVIDSVLCTNQKNTCVLSDKNSYNQILKYVYKKDGSIHFLNTQFQNNWVDKLLTNYLTIETDNKILEAKNGNYFIEYLPKETIKVQGQNYTVYNIVYENTNHSSELKIPEYTILKEIYVQLPSKILFEKNLKTGKIVKWTQ